MSDHVELIRELFDVLNEGGWAALLDRFDDFATPDGAWHPALAGVVEGEMYVGREGFERYQRDFEASFHSPHYESLDIRDVGPDHIVALGRLLAQGKGSGIQLEQDVGWVIRFQGDRVAEARSYTSHAAALAAVEAHTGA